MAFKVAAIGLVLLSVAIAERFNADNVRAALSSRGLKEFNSLGHKARKHAIQELVSNAIPLHDGISLGFNRLTGKVNRACVTP